MRIIIANAMLIIMCFPLSLYAQDNGQQKAQQAIDECRALSREDITSGVTDRMRQGMQQTSNCMEAHIVYLAKEYLYPQSPHLVAETKDDLEILSQKYNGFYWNLYNNTDACQPSCGTMHYVRSDAKYADLLEGMIRDIYLQIDLLNL